MKEKVGGIFAHRIELPLALTGREVMEIIELLAGEQFHKVHYYRNGDGYVIGRRTGYGFGGDIIITHSHMGDDLNMWREDSLYENLTVWDGLWNDGFIQDPPAETDNDPHDVTVASCLVFAKELESALKEACAVRAAAL